MQTDLALNNVEFTMSEIQQKITRHIKEAKKFILNKKKN